MRMIIVYDILVIPVKICPKGIDLDIRFHEELTIFVCNALNDFIYDANRDFFLGTILKLITDRTPVATYIDRLSVSWGGNIFAVLLCHGKPRFFSFVAEVMLDIEITSCF